MFSVVFIVNLRKEKGKFKIANIFLQLSMLADLKYVKNVDRVKMYFK